MHGADGAGVSISPLIAHYADRHHRQEDGERLPDLLVHPSFFDFPNNDVIALAQEVSAFFCYFSIDANRQSWAGERLALQDVFGHAEIAADAADFIFE